MIPNYIKVLVIISVVGIIYGVGYKTGYGYRDAKAVEHQLDAAIASAKALDSQQKRYNMLVGSESSKLKETLGKLAELRKKSNRQTKAITNVVETSGCSHLGIPFTKLFSNMHHRSKSKNTTSPDK